jgi:AraC-like DNA-binding protein
VVRVKYQSHLTLEELDLPPSTEWEGPAQGWCFARVAQGQGYWLGRGDACEVNAGDVLMLPPARQGVFRASQLSVVRLFHFRFCPDLMSGLLTMTERQYFDRLAAKAGQPVRLLPVSHPVARQFADLCEEAEGRNGLLLRCEMLELVGRIFERELAPKDRDEASTLSATKRIRVLLEHLTEEEFLNASSDDLAAYCGCSPRHFSRLFQQHFGVSLRSRQTEMRLLKARRLLAETDSRVMTVAAACGYRHLGVFNALFKKRFSMTPTEWRRKAGDPKHGNGACPPADVASPTPKAGRKQSSGNGPVVTEK